MKTKKMALFINFLIIISSIIGLIITFKSNNFMSSSALYYYTVQSNILIAIIMIIFLIYQIFKIKIPQLLYIIKFVITVGMTLTFLVFLLMLMPQIILNGNINYLLSISNITLHFISPIFAIISFILFDNFKVNKNYCYLGIIMPLYYLIFTLIIANITKDGIFKNFDGTISKFPYFFLDYEKNGWWTFNNNFFEIGTFYWIIIISIVIILIGKLFLFQNKKRKKQLLFSI